MRKEVARHFLETGDGFSTNFDFRKLSEYLQIIPDSVVSQNSNLEKLVIRQLTSAKNIVLQELPKLNDSREDLFINEEIDVTKVVLPETNIFNFFKSLKSNFSYQKLKYIRKNQ